MKLLLVHITGLATAPYDDLDRRTLVEASSTSALDELARRGSCGLTPLLPEGLVGGAGLELLGLLDYLQEDVAPPSLGALEATGVGAPLYPRDVAFRVNLAGLDESGRVTATSGIGIPTADALALMEVADEKLSTRRLRFYPGQHTAHVMVWTDGPAEVQCVPAPLAEGRALEEVLPLGDGDGPLRQLIYDSVGLLGGHRVNHRRRGEGLPPYDLLWPWSPGLPPNLRHFALKTGARAVALASRLDVVGAARALGMAVRAPDQDLGRACAGLAEAAAASDLAYLHLDLGSLFEHAADPETHVRAMERLDRELVGPLLDEVRKSAEAVRLILVGTWPEEGWVARPAVVWAAYPPLRGRLATAELFSEEALAEGLRFDEPGRLLRESRGPLG